MPSVEPWPSKGKGWYRARLSLGKDPLTGKYPRKSVIFYARSPSRAKAMAAEMEGRAQLDREMASGGLTTSAPFTILAREYLANAQVSRKTLHLNESLLRNHVLPRIGDVPIDEIDGPTIARLRSDLSRNTELAARSVNACLIAVSAAFSWAVEQGYARDNPARSVKRLKPDADLVLAAPVEDYLRISAWLAENNADLGAIVDLIAHTGLRRGEALGLRWMDVDEVGKRLYVSRGVDQWRTIIPTKTRRERVVWLGDDGVEVLRAHREREIKRYEGIFGSVRSGVQPEWLIFPSIKDPTVPRSPDAVSRQLERSCRRAGINPAIRLHQLRHLAATLMIAAGVDGRTAASQLGHSSPTMTLGTYAHVVEPQARAAAEAIGRGLRPGNP